MNHTVTEIGSFVQSNALQKRFNEIIPGGSHTYAKGDDQYPETSLPYIVRGKGCHIWDVDGNEFIEYAMGLRSVTLGHAFTPVNEAAKQAMDLGINFNRPATIELECAEMVLDIIKGQEMVKFAKNGSDATSAAVLLARAYTGRDMIAICGDHPFFSVEGWFIGTTAVNSGIPKAIQDMTVKFKYNDLQSLKDLFDQYPNQIACIILEAEKDVPPAPNYFKELKKLCHDNGAVFILDEIITGFRWHNGGAQTMYDIQPDLASFGKAIANGFALSALVGKKEIMQLGGLQHDKDRVFLMSTTYGAESHALAAAMATIKVYQQEPVIQHLYTQGAKLRKGIEQSVQELHLEGHFGVSGKDCALVYYTKDQQKQPSQPYRTLFLQETMKRGLLAPSLIVSYSHSDQDVAQTLDIIHESLQVYRKALDEGIEKYLLGRPVKPVYRKKN
ncbi:glutamate-1-semialdehyde 2,1-aminomutase [Cytophagaceae bacterium YF14B1]|uniref:Glutamate-1-semialdehyde 2,1-aminomutase n=1 Tax=Xanthocytophaga flava TaxID=3048013 RepID=A0AAE3UAD4_9BACT|nr:glutamate-1-semialdehyde 2,1-aminomutase [Xanthocytophaga flavus]MDJ1484577.1 glutamate-1-semialdehyde 2,1-aminomutase [Xanthocytophaga flavus]